MRVSLVRADTPYPLPRAAVAAGVVLVLLGLIAAAAATGGGPVVCPFRLVTGLPCPTCGMVRATRHVLNGEPADAWRTNPLDAATLLIGAPLAACLLIANRLGRWAVRMRVSRTERRMLWISAALLLGANWAYVLRSGI
ncbi:MAG: DUF2752 domain-containing protein [Candidatus Eisenbacteria bacterium]|nr:DUF2752 domain-containing protein [Candidatus Eisenbacteria bacterium]